MKASQKPLKKKTKEKQCYQATKKEKKKTMKEKDKMPA